VHNSIPYKYFVFEKENLIHQNWISEFSSTKGAITNPATVRTNPI